MIKWQIHIHVDRNKTRALQWTQNICKKIRFKIQLEGRENGSKHQDLGKDDKINDIISSHDSKYETHKQRA